MDMSIGKFRGIEQTTHTAQKSAEPQGMPKTYEDAFASSNVQDMQASCKAYMKKTEKENPLTKRTIISFKRGEHPYGGKEITGPAINIPLNRVGG
ncbi:MAG: hypothetical protein K1060chlam1_00123 [Candidatus Anoxychlamydiales bacterium]|nr:hypothetical protein [Candidatus Anoxychlamydiales bacterium]